MTIHKKKMALGIIVAILIVGVIPMGPGKESYSATTEAKTKSIEVVDIPEDGTFYVGLDNMEIFEKIKLKVTLNDNTEKIMLLADFMELDQVNSIYAKTSVEYNQDEEGNNGDLKEGANKITVNYEEWKKVPIEDDDWKPETLKKLQTTFEVNGVHFDGFDPSLENNKSLKGEVSDFGNEILFSNEELWKASKGSIKYSKKDNIKGIVKEVYHNMYLDGSNQLTVENLKGEEYKKFKDVKDFGRNYILQNDGKLIFIEDCWCEDSSVLNDYEVARDVDSCISEKEIDYYYTINKDGKAILYECHDLEGFSVDHYEMDTQKVKAISTVSDFESAYYLTEDGKLKKFWTYWTDMEHGKTGRTPMAAKNQEIIGGINELIGPFAISTDDRTYSLEGQKLLDTKIIDFKTMNGGNYAGDDQGNLYVYESRRDYNDDQSVTNTYEIKLAAKNFSSFSTYGYYDKNGKQHGLPYYEYDNPTWQIEPNPWLDYDLKEDDTVYLGDQKLLTNVVSIGCITDSDTYVMGRKDGTVWIFDQTSRFSENRKRIATPQKLSQELLDEVFDVTDKKKDINELTFNYQKEVLFDGYLIEPPVTILDGNRILTESRDYTLSYKDNGELGQATIIVTGKGEYTGKKLLHFSIIKQKPVTPKPVTPSKPAKANQSINGADTFTKAYGSKPFTLNATTTGNGQLSYRSSNPKIATVSSTGKVTIKNTGNVQIVITAAATENYNAASKTVTITINPKKAAGLKAKAGKKRMSVSWKKDTRASGYQITYAQNKKFTKGKKNVTVSKNKTTKKTVKKLKSKKTYYVKVRAYKKAGSQKLYGAYSSVKKVKIK